MYADLSNLQALVKDYHDEVQLARQSQRNDSLRVHQKLDALAQDIQSLHTAINNLSQQLNKSGGNSNIAR